MSRQLNARKAEVRVKPSDRSLNQWLIEPSSHYWAKYARTCDWSRGRFFRRPRLLHANAILCHELTALQRFSSVSHVSCCSRLSRYLTFSQPSFWLKLTINLCRFLIPRSTFNVRILRGNCCVLSLSHYFNL